MNQKSNPPAGHGDLHLGGGDAPADGVEVTHGGCGLFHLVHLVHDVPLHAYRRAGPAPRAARVPLEPTAQRVRAGAQQPSELQPIRSAHSA